MTPKNEEKLRKVKNLLDDKGIFYNTFANGQLQVDNVNLWVTSEKFYDTKTGYIGNGINSFLQYLKNKEANNE